MCATPPGKHLSWPHDGPAPAISEKRPLAATWFMCLAQPCTNEPAPLGRQEPSSDQLQSHQDLLGEATKWDVLFQCLRGTEGTFHGAGGLVQLLALRGGRRWSRTDFCLLDCRVKAGVGYRDSLDTGNHRTGKASPLKCPPPQPLSLLEMTKPCKRRVSRRAALGQKPPKLPLLQHC